MDVFENNVTLFENEEDEEGLRVECALTKEGGLLVLQESEGPLTEWCFEESPHRIEVEVERESVHRLLDYFNLDEGWQLPFVLRFEYADFDSCQRIRGLLRRLGLSYRVIEQPITR